MDKKLFKTSMKEVADVLSKDTCIVTNVKTDIIKHPELPNVMSMSVKMNGVLFTFFEDEGDGYRSTLEDEVMVSSGDHLLSIYEVECEVKYIDTSMFLGLHFYPVDGEVSENPFIEIGTDYYDVYYPCCIMRVNPLEYNTLEGALSLQGFYDYKKKD